MAIFAISDPHLSLAKPKPMTIFGAQWTDHWQQIQANWCARVQPDDLVLIPGDISWAMQLADAQLDLDAIGALPGQKLLLRGNHDYWWGSLARVRRALPEGMYALQNDHFVYRDQVIAGTRGWTCPGSPGFSEQDQRLYEREVQRLELSLKSAARTGKHLAVAMMHYPPFNEKREENGFLRLFAAYGVQKVIYGHLHGRSLAYAFEGEHEGIQYRLVSCDHLQFTPLLIRE